MKCSYCRKEFTSEDKIAIFEGRQMHSQGGKDHANCLLDTLMYLHGDKIHIVSLEEAKEAKKEHIGYLKRKIKEMEEDIK